MSGTGHRGFASLALIGIVGAVSLPPLCAGGAFAGPGHPSAFALPPPDPSYLCPFLEEPTIALSVLERFDALAVDDGHALPLASRAPPASA